MPPHPKQTREDVLATAVQLVRSGGLASVNARDLAAALDISTRPLFTLFSSMDELKQQLLDKLNRYYNAYMDKHMRGDNRLVAQATSYIAFAREEPRIFDELFMNRTMQGFSQGLAVCARYRNTDCGKRYSNSRGDGSKSYSRRVRALRARSVRNRFRLRVNISRHCGRCSIARERHEPCLNVWTNFLIQGSTSMTSTS